jgi:hypothetical protein
LRELDRCADLLGRYPRVGRPHRGVHRKLLVPNHPYGVFYAVLKSDSIKRVYALKVNDDESDSILSCIVDLWIENRNDSQECGIADWLSFLLRPSGRSFAPGKEAQVLRIIQFQGTPNSGSPEPATLRDFSPSLMISEIHRALYQSPDENYNLPVLVVPEMHGHPSRSSGELSRMFYLSATVMTTVGFGE